MSNTPDAVLAYLNVQLTLASVVLRDASMAPAQVADILDETLHKVTEAMTPQATDLPRTSSGVLWTADEDERLYKAMCKLTVQLPGRSLSAILTRIASQAPIWWRRKP